MSFKSLLIAMLGASVIFVAGCKTNEPVTNYQSTPVATKSGKQDLAKVKKAIVVAGTKAGWQMQPIADGHILAAIFSRGHTAKIDIKYSVDTYSITYRESSNLQYDGTNIHRDYNAWVNELNQNIRDELSKL